MSEHRDRRHQLPVASIGRDAALAAVAAAYRGVGEAVAGLPEPDFLRPTRCAGWAVLDVLAHLLMDAQRGLVALATPATSPPDADFVSYWRGHTPDHPRAAAHARFVRVTAAAYSRPAGLVAHLEETTAAVVRAATAAPPAGCVATQGHVLRLPDLLVTLAVEAAVHHLDLIDQLPAAPGPGAAPLALVRRTLDGLLGRPLPVGWDDGEYALKGTGRVALTTAERDALGALAARFPLFG